MEEVNGPDCLWRDGEYEAEGGPEEWIDRVADEVEGDKTPEDASARETRGRRKRNKLLDGISVKRWKRRSRLVAREFAFAEGKRDYIFSAATSGHALKLLPTIFLQRSSKEDGAREGEGAFSPTIECLDVKGAFLQVPQEKPLKVILRGKELLVKRNLPGQRDGAKACFDFSTEYFTEELNYQFSAECPCLGRVPF